MKNLDYGKLFSDYGNVLVLLVLCAVVSFVTMEEQSPRSEAAAERLAKQREAAMDDVELVLRRELRRREDDRPDAPRQLPRGERRVARASRECRVSRYHPHARRVSAG